MPIQNLVYDLDPVQDKLKDLENRVAVLEGKEPIHKKFCKACKDTGFVETLIGDHQTGDTMVPCKFCNKNKYN